MVAKRVFQGITIECIQGDIASQSDMDAVVNAANAELRMGGGVAGAIHRKAGPGLEKECREFAPIRPGQAVITGAYDLPNRYVIHCLGPVYGVDKPSDKLLASCYRNALQLAEGKVITSIAFPAISAGVFGYPMDSAARIAFKTIFDNLSGLTSVKHIRFVLLSEPDQRIYEQVFSEYDET